MSLWLSMAGCHPELLTIIKARHKSTKVPVRGACQTPSWAGQKHGVPTVAMHRDHGCLRLSFCGLQRVSRQSVSSEGGLLASAFAIAEGARWLGISLGNARPLWCSLTAKPDGSSSRFSSACVVVCHTGGFKLTVSKGQYDKKWGERFVCADGVSWVVVVVELRILRLGKGWGKGRTPGLSSADGGSFAAVSWSVGTASWASSAIKTSRLDQSPQTQSCQATAGFRHQHS